MMAHLLLQSTILSSSMSSLFPLFCSDPTFSPLLRTTSEWWYTPVVDSLEKVPRQKPCTSCHLSVEGTVHRGKLLVTTACIITCVDKDRFMSYTDEFKYLGSFLRSKWTTKLMQMGESSKPKEGQFQVMRENVLPKTHRYNFPSDQIPQCSYYHHGSIRMQQF